MGTPLKDIEREVIQRTLKMVNGDKNRAAEILELPQEPSTGAKQSGKKILRT